MLYLLNDPLLMSVDDRILGQLWEIKRDSCHLTYTLDRLNIYLQQETRDVWAFGIRVIRWQIIQCQLHDRSIQSDLIN